MHGRTDLVELYRETIHYYFTAENRAFKDAPSSEREGQERLPQPTFSARKTRATHRVLVYGPAGKQKMVTRTTDASLVSPSQTNQMPAPC
jgi:hypothetical protein